MERVLVNALNSLTIRVNLTTGLTHPLDMDSAKEMFKILHSNGVKLNDTEIQIWSQANDWQISDARELGRLGQRIGDGGRVQTKNKNCWGSDSFSVWQQES